MGRLSVRSNLALVSLFLLVQSAIYYGFSKAEVIPSAAPLRDLPGEIGAWRLVREVPLETEVENLLKATEIVNRVYTERDGQGPVLLFVAYFRTQQGGISPHSPKVCLPGAGWAASEAGRIRLDVGAEQPIEINRYTVTRGTSKSVVLYWYQTSRRVIADEYQAKWYSIIDGLRYRRSDTTLVRIIVPSEGGDGGQASSKATDFAKAVYPILLRQLPGRTIGSSKGS